jgi:hypothetical protein
MCAEDAADFLGISVADLAKLENGPTKITKTAVDFEGKTTEYT